MYFWPVIEAFDRYARAGMNSRRRPAIAEQQRAAPGTRQAPPRPAVGSGRACGGCAILCACVPSGCFLPSRADLPVVGAAAPRLEGRFHCRWASPEGL